MLNNQRVTVAYLLLNWFLSKQTMLTVTYQLFSFQVWKNVNPSSLHCTGTTFHVFCRLATFFQPGIFGDDERTGQARSELRQGNFHGDFPWHNQKLLVAHAVRRLARPKLQLRVLDWRRREGWQLSESNPLYRPDQIAQSCLSSRLRLT